MRYFIIAFLITVSAPGAAQSPQRTGKAENTTAYAAANAAGFGKLLGLTMEQQSRWEAVDLQFYEKRNARAAGAGRSSGEVNLLAWREAEIAKILSPQQLTLYRQRQQQLGAKAAQRAPGPPAGAVKLKPK